MSIKAAILGTGYYVPEKIVTNFDLEKTLDTTDAWIDQMTGIKERRVSGKNESTSDLAKIAAEKAVKMPGCHLKILIL